MRYPPGRKDETRRRILAAAAAVFRRDGLQAGSVDKVMAEAGLTPGGFYAHFASKEALFAEALASALRQARLLRGEGLEGEPSGPDAVRAVAAKYLSPAHRRAVEAGCPMPPLLSELARAGEPARRAFQAELEDLAAALETLLSEGGDGAATPPDRPLALLALLVGGLTLSRAVADEAVADRVLDACRALVDSGLPAPPARRRSKSPSRKPRKGVPSDEHGEPGPR